MLLHTWLPQTLRDAGINVVETSGWRSRSHGELPSNVKVVWHHDASPPGDSPGALNWMISNYPESSANIWVNRQGVWHMVGTGVSWHAGRVKDGMPDNFSSIGIETDHTTAELWPPAQLDSLRKGTAAIFAKQGVAADWLHFHKTICSPTGRKSDPDGLDLGPERSRVAKLITGGSTPPVKPEAPKPPTPEPPPSMDWNDDMPLIIGGKDRGSQAVIFGDQCVTMADSDSIKALRSAGVPFAQLTGKDYDRIRAQLVSEKG